MSKDILEKTLAALNALCGEKPLREVSLRETAERAGVSLVEVYRVAPSKTALVDHLGRRLDEAALATAATSSQGDAHDRLFDAAMARIEAMEPWRAVLAGIEPAEALPLAPHLPRAARAILEAAGVEATPVRLAAMTLVWARIVRVWRGDEGALNRTMAEIDLQLKLLRRRLNFLGQGF